MMNPAVASLRHDLRTVVNHLVGYGEMLLEDAEAAGQADRLASLERIRIASGDILAAIDELLPVSCSDLTAARGASLGEAVRDPANRILVECVLLGGAAEDSAAGADIARIVTSARLLLGFADNGPDALGSRAQIPAPRQSGVFPQVATETEVASRILVADDDATNRDILGRRLTKLGHDVTFAQDGRQALLLLEAEEFDLVLLDLMMPHINGSEVLQQLRANPRFRDLPVVMISALDEHENAVRCIARGADDYLHKPIDPVLLRARISACLERKRWRDQEAEYLRQVSLVTGAAAMLEAGTLTDGALDEVAARSDALGGLARVFGRMAHEVQAREQRLNQQVRQLRIEIDEVRKAKAVSEIVESDYFLELQRKVAELRRPTVAS